MISICNGCATFAGPGGIFREAPVPCTMATSKRKERTLTPAEARANRFMGARLRENEARYQEFLETLDPRERERLALGDPAE